MPPCLCYIPRVAPPSYSPVLNKSTHGTRSEAVFNFALETFSSNESRAVSGPHNTEPPFPSNSIIILSSPETLSDISSILQQKQQIIAKPKKQMLEIEKEPGKVQTYDRGLFGVTLSILDPRHEQP